MEVTKGKQMTPVKGVVFGPEGIGKSSLFSKTDAIYIDVEGGTNQLDVTRFKPSSYANTLQFLAEWKGQAKIIVIDTADWLEKQVTEKVCMAANKTGIEDFGYGKGFTFVAEEWKRLLDRIATLQSTYGTHVVFLAHAALKKFEQPDEAGSYDRWELKLSKTSSPILKEWADILLFCNYKTLVTATDETGKKFKAAGGKRVMFTSHHPAWDAKNRFDLPEEIPLSWDSIKHVFVDVKSAAPSRVMEKAAPAPAASPKTSEPTGETIPMDFKENKPKEATETAEPVIVESPERKELLGKLKQLMVDGKVTKEELTAELARKGVVPAGTHPTKYNDATIRRCIAGFSAIQNNINIQKNKEAA